MPRTLALILLAVLAPAIRAEISYRVTPQPETKSLQVQVTVPSQGPRVQVQVPNWAPGAYALANYRDQVKEMIATGPDGAVLSVERTDPNTWTVNAAPSQVIFTYSVPFQFNLDVGHYAGPGVYVYVVGRIPEACRLTLNLPETWRSACGLDETGANTYAAPNYDVLADNPVTVGKFESDSYKALGVPHTIVYYAGDPGSLDREAVVKTCQFISESQGSFFGGLPFSKYVWHFNVMEALDGGWGLEHLSSTTIGLAAGLGPGTVSVCSHEYFHAWNVKRIRSRVLGPFDYQVLPKTGALWWLEGVTDYYANVFLHRYGWYGTDIFHQALLSNLDRTRANQRRFEVSPYEASFRVGEANNGRGNSSGFGVSYYNTGWLVGLCLDIELRAATGGKRSLDDAVLRLWEMCKDDQPGFEEGAIREILVELGGVQLGEKYDQWVMKPGELPVEDQLAKVGLKIETIDVSFMDIGVAPQMAPKDGGVRVRQALRMARNVLQPRDVITAVDGAALDTSSFGKLAADWGEKLAALRPSSDVELTILRGDETLKVKIQVGQGQRKAKRIVPNGDTAKDELRNQWYFAGVKARQSQGGAGKE
ncbi:MAG: M61 family metallopeptidase [Fimbriimonadaceae bacterium]|nr:M61 family metallopeptidase [Fimbriimonadaceae bacterium]QYK58934.1 MAG: M61 family metallopeptidase [Fimbriimonadaceae bacterium]